MTAPATAKTAQEIAREAAWAFCKRQGLTSGGEHLTCEILRAIREAVEAIDARIESSARDDLHQASRIVRNAASGPNFADTFCLANRIGFIADALDELGRTKP